MKKKVAAKQKDTGRISAGEVEQLLVRSFGENAAVTADKANALEVSYFSSGAYGLDFELGGGWPRNRVIELFGPESAGKSTLLLITIAAFQQDFPEGEAWIVDYERTHTIAYASRFGVDLTRLHILSPDCGEQGMEMCMTICNQAAEETLLAVDSIAMMTPTKELEQEPEKQTPGSHARLIHKFMRGFLARTRVSMYDSDAPCFTAICLNQVRDNIGVMFGNPETTPGGRGMRFTPSMRVRLASNKTGYEGTKIIKGGVTRELQTGQVTTFTVHKNKAGGAKGASGEYRLKYNVMAGSPCAVDNGPALLSYGLFHEVIQPLSARQFHYPTYDFTGSKQDFFDVFDNQPEVALDLRKEILDAMAEARQTNEEPIGETIVGEEPSEIVTG